MRSIIQDGSDEMPPTIGGGNTLLGGTMEIRYKKLTKDELDTFIQMRIEQLREEGAKENIDLERRIEAER